jgi:ankyrin repeat protein
MARQRTRARIINYGKSLLNAIKDNDIEQVKKYIPDKTAIRAYNDFPLQRACTYGYYDIAKLLVENNACIKTNNYNAMRQASKYGHIEIVKFFLECDVESCNELMLFTAYNNGHLDIAKFN